MALGFLKRNRGYKLLAFAIACLIWFVAQGTSSVERGFDIPIAFRNLPEELVIVDQNSDVVNVRIQGTRAGLRNVAGEKLEYSIDVGGARSGQSDYEVDLSEMERELPRGARVVSRSPSNLEVTFERRGTKTVKIRPDLEGEPAPGFKLAGVDLDPPRVRIAGARSEVRRLSEVVTETIDIRGITETAEREVRVSIGAGHMWVEREQPVRVTIRVEPVADAASALPGQQG